MKRIIITFVLAFLMGSCALAGQKKALTIAVLNRCNLQEHHLDALRQHGNVVLFDTETSSQQEAIERLQGADIAIVNVRATLYDKYLFDHAKTLKFMAISSTSCGTMDVAAAKRNGIIVANAAGYTTETVAQHTLALMLASVDKVPLLNNMQHRNPFFINPNGLKQDLLKFESLMTFNLEGRTLGIVGLGNIGRRVAELGQAFKMKVIAYNRSPRKVAGVTMVSLEEVLKNSDILSLHVPYSHGTKNLINKGTLALMKPTAILINTTSSRVINEFDLYEALYKKKISGAALDGLTFNDLKNPLLSLDNVVVTPHSSAYSEETPGNMASVIVNNVLAYINNNPINIVT